jgi:hypothetical protein
MAHPREDLMIAFDSTYPKDATNAAWQKQKSVIDKAKKATKVTGLGELLTKAETEYKKIDFALLDVGSAPGKHPNPDFFNAPEHFDNAKHVAEEHLLRVVRPARQAMRTAAVEAEKIRENSDKLYTATTAAAAGKVEKALKDREVLLRDITLNDFEEKKQEKMRRGQELAQNFGVMLNEALHEGDLFIHQVKQTPTAVVFNTGIEKASRKLTTQIGNVNKYKSQGAPINKEQPTALHEELKPWANDGQRLSGQATREEVLEALTRYERIVHDIRVWWA